MPSLSEMDYRKHVKSWKNLTDNPYDLFRSYVGSIRVMLFQGQKKGPFREKRALIK
jgi:hypothetical protein